MTTPILETERLTLRPLRLADAPRIQELFANWEVLRYLTAAVPWPYPETGAEEFLARVLPKMENETEFLWAMIERSAQDDLLIGLIHLFPSTPDDNRGFWIGVPYQGKGYMTEAVAAVNDFAFETLGLAHLILNNAEPNLGSHRLKEKSGASIIETTEGVPYVSGKFRQIRWKLTREQWRDHREGFLPKTATSTPSAA